jgi:hypothetical protein
MHGLRKSFLWLSLGCLAATVEAQESATNAPVVQPIASSEWNARPVQLGQPTRLGAEPTAPAEVNAALSPQEVPQPANRAGNSTQARPPSKVRMSRSLLEDEPNNLFLPREYSPPEQVMPLPNTALPATRQDAKSPRTAQAVEPIPPKDKAKIIEIDKNGKTWVPPQPKEGLPKIVDQCPPIVVHDDHPVLVDEHGDAVFGNGQTDFPRWYGSAEVLLWRTNGYNLPPLITTGPATGPFDTRGALGSPGTQLLFGDGDTSSGLRTGGRFTVGHTLDDCGLFSLEGTIFFLGNQNDSFVANSSQYPVLARPFFSINQGVQNSEVATSPDVKFTGNISVQTSSQLWGGEANLRTLLWCDCGLQITGIVGFRYLDLREGLGITENILAGSAIPGGPGFAAINVGDQITVSDSFNTRNQFYGGQVGLNSEWRSGRWTLDTGFKIALGVTEQSVDINGGQSIASVNGQRQDFVGGLYALNSNIGNHSQSRFTVVPEATLKLGYDVTENIRLFVSYDVMYWSSVMRPGDQIDQVLDVTRIPNSGAASVGILPSSQTRPIVPFRTSAYWAQGVTAGVEFRY